MSPEPARSVARRLKVIAPGAFTTVQDAGRHGYLNQGLPPSGALDRIGLALANTLVGAPPGAAALELLLTGPTLEIEGDCLSVALAGPAVASVRRGGIWLALPPCRSVRLSPGDIIWAGPISGAACAYLSVDGGIATPPVLGSRSTYRPAGFGGLDGRPLRAGDRVPLSDAAGRARPDLMLEPGPGLYGDGPIRVVPGPQKEAFTDAGWEALLTGHFQVTPRSDRMGLRLRGPVIGHRTAYEIPSEGIAPGSIQVPGNGQPILLLVDRQTVGGYAKIATVASVDLPRCGRLRPGETVRFTAIERAEAERLRRQQEACLISTLAGCRPAHPLGRIDPPRLLAGNLISGVIDALEPPGF